MASWKSCHLSWCEINIFWHFMCIICKGLLLYFHILQPSYLIIFFLLWIGFLFSSIFYVFYEQYLTTWPDTLFSIGVSLAAIFVVTFLLMGLDVFSSIVVVITITMIVVNIGGLMYWWHITLNAVSLVNLVMVSIWMHLKE